MPESTKLTELSELFGDGKLSYSELSVKAGEAGIEIGNIGLIKLEYNAKLHELRCKNALERALDKSGAKNRELVTKILDMSRVTSDEDGVYGLSEQIEALKESDPYLFEGETKAKPTAVMFSSGITHGIGDSDPERMNDRDYYKKIKKL